MVSTRVGYTGGTTADPTYLSIGDHSEAFQVVYDPDKISYEELLEQFWSNHNPCAPSWSTQYASALFYHNKKQLDAAMKSRKAEQAKRTLKIKTPIVAATTFYQAEDYHQKYYLRQNHKLAREFMKIYPDPQDFVRSTAAARINGYLGGHGRDHLEETLPQLGLTVSGANSLRKP